MRLHAERAAEPDAVDLEGHRCRTRCVHVGDLRVGQHPFVVAGRHLAAVGDHVQAVVRPVGCGEPVDRTEHGPQPELPRQPCGQGQFLLEHVPSEPAPVRRSDLVGAVGGQQPLVRKADRALGELHDPRTGRTCPVHQTPYLGPTGPQFGAAAGVLTGRGLSHGQTQVVLFRHDVSSRSRTEMPEGSRIGLAGLGGAGAHPALEIPVGCHLAFHATGASPQRPHPRRSDHDSDLRQEVPLPPWKTELGTAGGGEA